MLLLHKDGKITAKYMLDYCKLHQCNFVITFRVRAKALQYFAQCATSENDVLVTRVKETLRDPLQRPAEGTPTVNRQSNGESLMDYVK